MKLLKALWKGLGDDRIGLILAGVALAIAGAEFKAGDYSAAVIDLGFSLIIGILSWRDLGRAVRP